jgi:outer membrane protein assembly factor BamB
VGFLKKYIIFAVTAILMFSGCNTSSIKLNRYDDRQVYSMYGKTPARDFFNPVDLKDSVNLLWEAEANGSFTQTSVIYVGEHLFINDLSGRIFCYNIYTGKTIGQLKHKNPIFTSPVINKYNIIYIESMNTEDKSVLRVYNLLESKAFAEREFKGRVLTEMLMVDQEIYFTTEKGLLYKFSVSGEQIWMTELKANVRTSPVYDGKYIYVATDNGEILVLEASAGKIINRFSTGSIISSGLTLRDNTILAGGRDGMLYSINKNNGQINWKYNSGSSINAVPVVSGSRVYIVNLGGAIISLNSATGDEYWRTDTEGVLNVTPLLTNNYLIIPDLSNRIIFTDIKDGKVIRTIDLPNRAKLSPVLRDNILIIGFDRGVLRAYEFM